MINSLILLKYLIKFFKVIIANKSFKYNMFFIKYNFFFSLKFQNKKYKLIYFTLFFLYIIVNANLLIYKILYLIPLALNLEIQVTKFVFYIIIVYLY